MNPIEILKLLIILGKIVVFPILGFASGVVVGLIYDWIVTRRRNKK